MFKVITTGKNLNYGKKGEKRLLADSYVLSAVKKGWVEPEIKYDGNGSMNLKIIPIYDKCRKCGHIDNPLKIEQTQKAEIFIEHIQKHLDNNEFDKKGSEITKGKVGCTICGKDIDQIFEEETNIFQYLKNEQNNNQGEI